MLLNITQIYIIRCFENFNEKKKKQQSLQGCNQYKMSRSRAWVLT